MHIFFENNNRFGRKYDYFLSEASNEEIVAVSKELTDGLSEQAHLVFRGAAALISVTILSLILSVMTLSGIEDGLAGSAKTAVFALRMAAVMLLCFSGFIEYYAAERSLSVVSAAPIMWRHVRESPTDENAFSQSEAVRSMGRTASAAKSLLAMSVFVLAVSGLLIGISYMFQMMSEYGYV